MQSWEQVFRKGFLPHMTEAEKSRLLKGCRTNDPKLIQGKTTDPPPLECVKDWNCEGGCGLGYAAMAEKTTVGEVEERFAQLCFFADQLLGEPAACRWFLNWFDDYSREKVLKELVRVLTEEGVQ